MQAVAGYEFLNGSFWLRIHTPGDFQTLGPEAESAQRKSLDHWPQVLITDCDLEILGFPKTL